MKFTVSTLAALTLAAPMAAAEVFDNSIPIESTINGGLMKLFYPSVGPVKLQFEEGHPPQHISDLSFIALYESKRFDIIDDRHEGQPTENHYYRCDVQIRTDLGLKEGKHVKISVGGTLDQPEVTIGDFEDQVTVDCRWLENGKLG